METHANTVLLHFFNCSYTLVRVISGLLMEKIEFELQLNIDIFKTPVHVNGGPFETKVRAIT